MPESPELHAPRALQGVRILAVEEDDFLVMLELVTMLLDAGATVQSCGTVAQALGSAEKETFAAAVLDVRVGRESVAPVAQKLTALNTPFVFYTGQVVSDPTMAQWPKAAVVSKPTPPSLLIKALVETLRPPVNLR
jgi:DNA-binding NtrC family response regulator